MASKACVYLVGAGPGDPGLLTLRAAECLRLAEVVLFDKLVDRRIVEMAARAKAVCVEELPGPHAERQPHINRRLIEAARAGKVVVRLKGGDPLIFGRGGEEVDALREAGIDYEIVAGVTAALAAGACAGIPLTHRGHASAVALVTGHECPGKTDSLLDWAALARFPGTLVIYMGVARLPAIAQALMDNGKPAHTPAAVVEWASLGRQRTVQGTLANVADRVKAAGLAAPAVAIIGPVVDLRDRLHWLEKRPLFGRRVLVTRPRGQAETLVRRLENLGATVHALPVAEIGPPPNLAKVDEAIERLPTFDWLVFTSANGVEAFFGRLFELGKDLRQLAKVKLAAIGPRTAEALRSFHLNADLVPDAYRSEELAEALSPKVRGRRVLLARADRGRDLLRNQLGADAQVEQVAVYSQRDCPAADPEVLDLLRQGRIDFVTLTSSNIARAFVGLLDEESHRKLGNQTKIVTISPVTSDAVRELGFEVWSEAKEFTAEGVVLAMVGST